MHWGLKWDFISQRTYECLPCCAEFHSQKSCGQEPARIILLVCFSWTGANLLKWAHVWEMGMWVPVWKGEVHVCPQPRLPQECFSVLAGTLPAVTIQLQFLPLFPSWHTPKDHVPVENIMHFKMFLKNETFYLLASSTAKDKGEKNRVSPSQYPPPHYRFFSQFPLGLCLLRAAFLISGKSLPTGCLDMERAGNFSLSSSLSAFQPVLVCGGYAGSAQCFSVPLNYPTAIWVLWSFPAESHFLTFTSY